MTQFRGPRAAVRWLVPLSFLVALGVVPTAAGAPAGDSSPSQGLTPATAEAILPDGYVKQGDDYIYEGGDVIVTPAESSMQLGCTSGYVCLYRHSDYQGSRWQFRDEFWQNLRRWGASDEVSSWKNRQSSDRARLGWDSIEQGIDPTFKMVAGGEAAHMGNWNDQASSVHG